MLLQGGQHRRVRLTGHRTTGVALELLDRTAGARAHQAVDRARIVAMPRQQLLDLAHLLPPSPAGRRTGNLHSTASWAHRVAEGRAAELAHPLDDFSVDGSRRVIVDSWCVIAERAYKLSGAAGVNSNNLGSSLTGALNDGGAGGPGLGGAVVGIHSS